MSSQEHWIKSILDSCWKPGQIQGGVRTAGKHTGWAESFTKVIGFESSLIISDILKQCLVLLVIIID